MAKVGMTFHFKNMLPNHLMPIAPGLNKALLILQKKTWEIMVHRMSWQLQLGTQIFNAVTPLSQSDLRHMFYFITYLAGVWAFYALGMRWLTRNAALGATLLFITQPLLWGHAFMNPKDTPFLAFFLLSIFFGFKMADDIKPLSFDSLAPSAKKTLTLLTALWLVSVSLLFIFTDAFHAALTKPCPCRPVG